MKNILDLTLLGKSFPTPKGTLRVVHDFDLKIKSGEFVSLIGHSGCGKSTVLSMVAGLEKPTTGGVIFAGRQVDEAGPDRGVVFQAPCLLPWMTAYQNVMLGVNQVFFTASKSERRQIVEYYLTVVGIGDVMHKRPHELSQGMRQRVGIARAFALSPKMLLLDEPFGMLDKLTKFELQQVLLDLWERTRLTALLVTHDVDEAIFLSDRVVMMTDGPEAQVGDILEVNLPRPRNRETLLDSARFIECRAHLLDFLHHKSHLRGNQRPLVANSTRP
jgi:nitrate ABC transporter ATP-binding subunit